jgi:hypothetical protein
MSKNCWEVKKCGREPGGVNEKSLGLCIASVMEKTDGLNNGINAGRVCWAVAGTLCGGEVQGTFAKKMATCLQCEFYQLVATDEVFDFVPSKEVLKFIEV